MRPIHEMLLQAQGHARFHMPGHKGALDPFDMTELPSTDDLYHPQGAIREAERWIAQAAGAGDAILLTGGATAGNLTMLLYASTRYRAIRMERTAHVSAVSGLVLGDMEVGESGAVFATGRIILAAQARCPKRICCWWTKRTARISTGGIRRPTPGGWARICGCSPRTRLCPRSRAAHGY